MRKFLVILVVLVALLIVLDRAGLLIAEREIGTRVESAYHLPARPGVTIHGFPFLTQVASGHYQEVDVSIGQASAGGVHVRDLHVRFTGVRASLSLLLGQDAGGVTAQRATGSAMIPFAQVERKLPKGVTLGADGSSLRVRGTTALGSVQGIARLGVTSTGISVTPESLSVGGVIQRALDGRFTFVIPLGSLPLHLTVTGVHVSRGGLVVDAAGRDVEFASA
jgi:LmeA-like phospholipid-binding